jgi:PTS system cellobiose-specific IIB component
MKILLVCSGGMSTAIVVKALEQEAAKTGRTVTVKAAAASELAETVKDGWDIVLVAPQVRYRLGELSAVAGEAGVPVALIPPQGYSPAGGAVILREVDKILG